MRDRAFILGGLGLFVAMITFPFWYNLAAGTKSGAPELKMPDREKQCVASKKFMRTSHMDLLIAWRDQVVRGEGRTYRAPDGRAFDMSLTKTCMKCHADKEQFCDRCHAYAGVDPYCWECHIDPKLVQRSIG